MNHNQTTALLKAGIALEENKKRRAEVTIAQSGEDFLADQAAFDNLLTEHSATKKQLNRVTEQNTTLLTLIEPMVQEMESHVDRGTLASVEIAEAYIKLAEFLKDEFKRDDQRRIEYAKEWIKSPESLPY